MHRSHIAVIVLVLLFANAIAILFLTYFNTVDGPMHVFHASLLPIPWVSTAHLAQDMIYDQSALHNWFGDGVISCLLIFFSPEQAHALFAALVCCVLVLSVVSFIRAYNTRIGLATLWLLPITFSFTLFLGLFHFLLAIAFAFGTVAWWKARKHFTFSRWLGLLVGVTLSLWVHRFGPVLVCMIFLPVFLVELIQQHVSREDRVDPSSIARGAVILLLLSLCAFQLSRFVQLPSTPSIQDLPALNEYFLLRPLYLLDHVREQWIVHVIGVLYLISIAAGALVRYTLGRSLFWHDAFLALFVVIILVGWFYSAPGGDKLLVAERSQWLALVMIAVWLIAMADAPRKGPAYIIGGAALCLVPLQSVRLVQAEVSLAELQQAHISTMEASAALDPGSLVFPVLAKHHWLFQHLASYVAIDHSGILIGPKESVSFIHENRKKHNSDWLPMRIDSYWLLRHWREGIPPEVDQILFIGRGIDQKVNKHPWPVLLGERFQPSFENEFARIYTAVRDSTTSVSR